MALSNWDTLAIDLDGNPINGVFVSPMSGIRVEIYKNWVHIHDPNGWREGGRFVRDTVAQIQEGDLSFHDTHIRAIRGPQEGIYIVCWVIDWNDKDEKGKPKYHGMIGCGVYGFDGDKWVGVTKKSFQFLKDWVTKREPAFDEETLREMIDGFKKSFEKNPANVHGTPEEYEKEMRGIMDGEFDEKIANVDFSKALRFCQGDGFFEQALGSEQSGTPVGEAETPVLLKLFGGDSE